MIPTPSPPNRPPEIFGGSQDFITRLGPGCFRLPWFGIAAGGNDRMGPSVCYRIMTGAGVIGTVCSDHADIMIFGNLAQQFGQHWRVAHTIAGDLPLGDCCAIACRQ